MKQDITNVSYFIGQGLTHDGPRAYKTDVTGLVNFTDKINLNLTQQNRFELTDHSIS